MIAQNYDVTQHQRTTKHVNKLPKWAILELDDSFGKLYIVSPDDETTIEDARAEGWRVISRGHYWMRAREIREDLYDNANPFEVR